MRATESSKLVPPADLALERSVLGSALHSADLARQVASLTRELFFSEAHRDLLEVIQVVAPSLDGAPPSTALITGTARTRGGTVDAVLIAEALEEGISVFALDPHVETLRELAAQREEFAIRTMLHRAHERGSAIADVELWRDVESRLERARRLRGPVAAPPIATAAPLGEGLGLFLARTFGEPEAFIDGLLSSEGSGWIAGEEKLGKSMFAVHEALCLALGLPVAGRFQVPNRRRVLFLEEEDPPRRVWQRVRALLRGLDLDPDDAAVREDLGAFFRVSVWSGFTLDDPAMVARLDATLHAFPAEVAYLDVLRKLTTRSLNKQEEVGPFLAVLDDLRRRHGVIFRVLHHYRKAQGFRVGRGSQELGGSFALGAWGEASLFFEPVGRKQGAVKVEVQTKDGAPVPGFKLVIRGEGPTHATMLTITAEDLADEQSFDDVLLQAIASVPKAPAAVGKPGVAIAALVTALKKSDKTVRRALKRLEAAGLVLVTGQVSKGTLLYGVSGQ